MHVLIVEPLGMPSSHPQETGARFLRDLHEPGCGPDTTAFIQMVDNSFRFGLWEFGVE